MNHAMEIRASNLDASMLHLLVHCGLPIDDLGTAEGRARVWWFAARSGRETVGVIGLEEAGGDALLRSLAVHPDHRGTGLGKRLLAHAEQWARERGIARLYLLTTTAAAFFSACGYRSLAREAAPTAIRGSAQFADICPGSAEFMGRTL
ncbi:arsenic resistance N-acetyltransferase ArsN2 [Sediminicurvatus halobius]|uniref:N-acetyltransferase domain-containing protein n=1 Tax=Sediminicurvatus halobius TaxID=2182432 RepID=A0A2U2MWH4_9GAMM|nr:arsenic resistance N-acetyltransferase ArsN2 [Spiribacter halobius]PWG61215.1 hypothetical protein DEM34_17700 [Spiribacter halobius]UEX77954.1 arsenic resistance N-acetyltransferase ArsN2 [Spiribacter halobius]